MGVLADGFSPRVCTPHTCTMLLHRHATCRLLSLRRDCCGSLGGRRHLHSSTHAVQQPSPALFPSSPRSADKQHGGGRPPAPAPPYSPDCDTTIDSFLAVNWPAPHSIASAPGRHSQHRLSPPGSPLVDRAAAEDLLGQLDSTLAAGPLSEWSPAASRAQLVRAAEAIKAFSASSGPGRQRGAAEGAALAARLRHVARFAALGRVFQASGGGAAGSGGGGRRPALPSPPPSPHNNNSSSSSSSLRSPAQPVGTLQPPGNGAGVPLISLDATPHTGSARPSAGTPQRPLPLLSSSSPAAVASQGSPAQAAPQRGTSAAAVAAAVAETARRLKLATRPPGQGARPVGPLLAVRNALATGAGGASSSPRGGGNSKQAPLPPHASSGRAGSSQQNGRGAPGVPGRGGAPTPPRAAAQAASTTPSSNLKTTETKATSPAPSTYSAPTVELVLMEGVRTKPLPSPASGEAACGASAVGPVVGGGGLDGGPRSGPIISSATDRDGPDSNRAGSSGVNRTPPHTLRGVYDSSGTRLTVRDGVVSAVERVGGRNSAVEVSVPGLAAPITPNPAASEAADLSAPALLEGRGAASVLPVSLPTLSSILPSPAATSSVTQLPASSSVAVAVNAAATSSTPVPEAAAPSAVKPVAATPTAVLTTALAAVRTASASPTKKQRKAASTAASSSATGAGAVAVVPSPVLSSRVFSAPTASTPVSAPASVQSSSVDVDALVTTQAATELLTRRPAARRVSSAPAAAASAAAVSPQPKSRKPLAATASTTSTASTAVKPSSGVAGNPLSGVAVAAKQVVRGGKKGKTPLGTASEAGAAVPSPSPLAPSSKSVAGPTVVGGVGAEVLGNTLLAQAAGVQPLSSHSALEIPLL